MKIDVAGRDGAILSAVEVGLGSVLHGLRVPFSGHFLSLNQAFLLSRSALRSRANGAPRSLPFTISSIAALLKSLSPAGKKLTPMLAISAQGLLFSIGTVGFGAGPVGVVIGSVLAGLWAFVQPILIYYVLFGKTLLDVGEYFYEKVSEAVAFDRGDLLFILGIILGIKCVLSVGAGVLASVLPDSRTRGYEEAMLKVGRERRRGAFERDASGMSLGKKAWLAAGDLFNPLFVVSLALTALFFFFAEASSSKLIWALLRPVAVGFILFFAVRAAPFDRLLTVLERTRLRGFARSFRAAARGLREI